MISSTNSLSWSCGKQAIYKYHVLLISWSVKILLTSLEPDLWLNNTGNLAIVEELLVGIDTFLICNVYIWLPLHNLPLHVLLYPVDGR